MNRCAPPLAGRRLPRSKQAPAALAVVWKAEPGAVRRVRLGNEIDDEPPTKKTYAGASACGQPAARLDFARRRRRLLFGRRSESVAVSLSRGCTCSEEENVDAYAARVGSVVQIVQPIDAREADRHANARGPLRFTPESNGLDVHPGQVTVVKYHVTNEQNRAVSAQTIPSHAPQLAAGYFKKVDRFCFTQQTLPAHASREMPVVFYVHPKLPRDVRTITLSDTFFELDVPAGKTAQSGATQARVALKAVALARGA